MADQSKTCTWCGMIAKNPIVVDGKTYCDELWKEAQNCAQLGREYYRVDEIRERLLDEIEGP